MSPGSVEFKREILACLKTAIERRGLSIAAVERQLGRGRGYIGDTLREKKTLTIEFLTEVLSALNMDVKAFLAWTAKRLN